MGCFIYITVFQLINRRYFVITVKRRVVETLYISQNISRGITVCILATFVSYAGNRRSQLVRSLRCAVTMVDQLDGSRCGYTEDHKIISLVSSSFRRHVSRNPNKGGVNRQHEVSIKFSVPALLYSPQNHDAMCVDVLGKMDSRCPADLLSVVRKEKYTFVDLGAS